MSSIKGLEDLDAYEIIEERRIDDIGSQSCLLRHKKTGARIALLSNDDENKVFYIGFRTPPTDSTGVAHIIEHSVLCGSKQFPVKDPFVELVKGSLNTFLNAMTYTDKTLYPVASCNDKDFCNLMHVYMDAVFYPNIYNEKKIFMQEGWHYELESADSELKINGVVYNEMKGAFSDPGEINDREVVNSLFPDNSYGVESGGDPKSIPDLTYENFLDFHRRYYHPSNSYIYLYGNMDMAERLDWIDKNYLCNFEKIDIDSTIKPQKGFASISRINKEYPIMEGESPENNTYLSYNTVVGTSLDRELYYAMQILDYCLCSSSAAPLKRALISRNIGTEIYSTYENGIYQPYFSIVAKNANDNQADEFVETIENELKRLVKEGIDKKSLYAGLNICEFRYREADFGSYPKGLIYGLQMMDSWLYDDGMPFDIIEAINVFSTLREKIETDYYEGLIEKYLINNTHKSVLVLSPREGLTQKNDRELAEKLSRIKDSLSEAELERIAADTIALREFQEAEDSPEMIARIPMLSREDMKKNSDEFVNELREVNGTKVLFHDVRTNGICYVRLVFDVSGIPAELLKYAGILKNILGYVDTADYTYGELCDEINIHTGGIVSTVNTYINSKKLDEYKITFEFKTKAMYAELKNAFSLMGQIMTQSSFEDEKRIREIVEELKSRVQGNMTSAGHSVAALRAMSYFSETAAAADMISGVSSYRLLEELTKDFDTEKTDLISKLKELAGLIFCPGNFMVDITSDEEGYETAAELIGDLKQQLFEDKPRREAFGVSTSMLNEAFETSGQVQYVCRAGNYMKNTGLEYTGALKVLKVILGYDYLWVNVRVKGGAYGCMCSFTKSGDSYFVSYRDPHLEKTIDSYKGISEYLRSFDADEKTMTKYIIGAISDLDIPLTPSSKGSRSMGAYFSNMTFDEIQKERDEILGCTPEDIRKLADYVDAILAQNAVCVVGNSAKIKENSEIFGTIEPLFH